MDLFYVDLNPTAVNHITTVLHTMIDLADNKLAFLAAKGKSRKYWSKSKVLSETSNRSGISCSDSIFSFIFLSKKCS